MENSLLKMENISKVYGKNENETKALRNVNLCVERGEFLGITGMSGSGKTTLLNLLGCMDTATSGNYWIKGACVEKLSSGTLAKIRNETFGFVVQDYALVEYYSVYKNVEFPLIYGGKKNRKEKVVQVLKKLGIDNKMDEVVSNLSGGQKQRVAIARALVNDADVILADEPTGALDRKNGGQVLEILKELNKSGKTIILVTHDMQMVEQCHRIVKIEDGNLIDNYLPS